MSTPTPSIPGVDRYDLAAALLQDADVGPWKALGAADAAIAYIAAHQEPRACCACGAKCDKCPECAADDAYEEGRKDAACDREHDDEWVEMEVAALDNLPDGARVRSEWAMGGGGLQRFLVYRDDLPDPRTLIARELGPAKADTFLGLLDEHGWTVTRKGER